MGGGRWLLVGLNTPPFRAKVPKRFHYFFVQLLTTEELIKSSFSAASTDKSHSHPVILASGLAHSLLTIVKDPSEAPLYIRWIKYYVFI